MADDRTLKATLNVETTFKDAAGPGLRNLDEQGKQTAADVSASMRSVAESANTAAQGEETLGSAQAEVAASAQSTAEAMDQLAQSESEVATASEAEAESLQAAEAAAAAAAESVSALDDATLSASEAIASTADSTTALSEANSQLADSSAAAAAGMSVAAESAASLGAAVSALTEKERAAEQAELNNERALVDAYTRITAAAQKTESVIANLENRMASGMKPPRDGAAQLSAAYTALERSIIQTFGSLQSADPAAQEAIAEYYRLGAAIEQTNAAMGEFILKQNLAKDELKLASGQAVTAEQAIASLAGSYGGLIVKLGLYYAMAQIGIEIADKAASAIDDEGHAVEGFKEHIVSSAAAVKHAAYEAGGAALDEATAIASAGVKSREAAEAHDALANAELRLLVTMGNLIRSEKQTEEATNTLRAVQTAHLPMLQQLKLFYIDASVAGEAYRKTLNLGAVGQAEWTRIVAQSGGTLEGLIASVKRHEEELDRLAKKYPDLIKEQQLHEDELKHEIEQEKRLVESFDDETRKIVELVKNIGSLQAAREHLRETTAKEIEDAAKHQVATDGSTDSIQQLASKIAELSNKYGENEPFIQDLIKLLDEETHGTIAVSAEVKRHTEAITDDAKKIEELTAQNKALRTEIDSNTKSFDQMTRQELEDREAKERQILENKGLIDQIQLRIQEEAKAIESTKSSTAANKEHAQSVIEIRNAQGDLIAKDGQVIDTQNKLKTGVTEVSKATHSGAKEVSDLGAAASGAQDHMENLAEAGEKAGKTIATSGQGFDEAGKHIADLATKVVTAAEATKKFGEGLTQSAAAARKPGDDFKQVVKELGDTFKITNDLIDQHRTKVIDLTRAYENMTHAGINAIKVVNGLGEATSTAAGSSSGAPPNSTKSAHPGASGGW